MGKLFAGVFVIVGGALVACSADKASPLPTPGGGCLHAGVGPGAVPGVVIQGPGIDLQVRDPFGRGQAIGTSAVVRRTDGTLGGAEVEDTLNILSVYDIEGTFSATLTRPYYNDVTISNIPVSFTSDGCLPVTKVPVTLQLAPGAPALRAVTILGGQFLDHPGAAAHLVPYFDANPGVSTAVTWQVSDTTLATIDASSILTAKCTKSGGAVKVTVSSVADPSVTSSLEISVAPATSCP